MSKTSKKTAVLTEQMDVGTKEFNELQAILLNKSKKRTKADRRTIELISIKFQMLDYLRTDDRHSELVGDFLKIYLSTFQIKQNKFAEYIGIKPSNLTKLIKGERSLNHELALILGQIFSVDPMVWLDIQDKNKLYEISKINQFKKFSLDDLIH